MKRLKELKMAMPPDLMPGCLVSFITQKKGEKKAGVLYGDDVVHVAMWAGEVYPALKARARAVLFGPQSENMQAQCLAEIPEATRGLWAQVVEDLMKPDREPTRGNSSTYSPYIFPETGIAIPGFKVYTGKTASNGRVQGTLYLEGIKLGDQVLEPSANTPPLMNPKPVTLVRNWIKDHTVLGLYRKYSLQNLRPGSCVGPEAHLKLASSDLQLNHSALALFIP